MKTSYVECKPIRGSRIYRFFKVITRERWEKNWVNKNRFKHKNRSFGIYVRALWKYTEDTLMIKDAFDIGKYCSDNNIDVLKIVVRR